MDRAQARKKAEALVAKMTIEERAGQLKYDAPAIERLGIPTYNWWNEAHFMEWQEPVQQRYFPRRSVVRPCLMKRRCRRSLM